MYRLGASYCGRLERLRRWMVCQRMRDADDNKVSVCFCFMQEQVEDMERNAELGIIDLPFVMCLSAFQGSAR